MLAKHNASLSVLVLKKLTLTVQRRHMMYKQKNNYKGT